jgi:hypothetical protein
MIIGEAHFIKEKNKNKKKKMKNTDQKTRKNDAITFPSVSFPLKLRPGLVVSQPITNDHPLLFSTLFFTCRTSVRSS